MRQPASNGKKQTLVRIAQYVIQKRLYRKEIKRDMCSTQYMTYSVASTYVGDVPEILLKNDHADRFSVS